MAHAIVRDPLRLFDGNIFYPERNTLAYSESLIIPAIAAAPLLWAGVDRLERLRDFPRASSLAYLRERGVTILLVHSAFYIRGDFDADVRQLRNRADVEWVATFPWKGGHKTEAFRIRRLLNE